LYDIITVGSNTLDAFVHTNAELVKIHTGKKDNKEDELCLAYPLGAKILITNLEFHIGGGGTNTAASFKRLGLKTAYLGKIGHDENGEKIVRELKKLNIDFVGTFGKKSGFSVILDSKAHDRTILTHKGSNDNFRYSEVDKTKIKTKWFYFSSMMSSSLDLLKSLARYARKNNINLAFNPSNYLVIKGTSNLKPILRASNILVFNKEESFLLSKKKTIEDAFKYLIKKIKKQGVVVITDGPRGAYAYDGEILFYAKPKPVKILETTGAGDAFASAFTAAIIRGGSIKTALKAGMIQAESVIRCYGAKNKLLNHKEMNEELKKDKREIIMKEL